MNISYEEPGPGLNLSDLDVSSGSNTNNTGNTDNTGLPDINVSIDGSDHTFQLSELNITDPSLLNYTTEESMSLGSSGSFDSFDSIFSLNNNNIFHFIPTIPFDVDEEHIQHTDEQGNPLQHIGINTNTMNGTLNVTDSSGSTISFIVQDGQIVLPENTNMSQSHGGNKRKKTSKRLRRNIKSKKGGKSKKTNKKGGKSKKPNKKSIKKGGKSKKSNKKSIKKMRR
jgi:hypothetical protein